MSTTIGAHNVRVLRDSAFEIPKVRPAGDFGAFLAEQFRGFFEQIERFDGSLADRLQERAYWMRELSTSIEAVIDCTRQKRHDRAWQLMEDILDEHLGTLHRMSLRHAYKVTGSRSWYRLTTWAEAKTRRDVFHLPFQLKSPSYRFSPPGRPAIYLGNNVYVCWLECQKPPLETCRVARFEIQRHDDDYFLDLPANHAAYFEPIVAAETLGAHLEIDPRRIMNSPYYDDVEGELVEYLSVWPLLTAMTVQKHQSSSADPPEYLIPQLLMQWVLKRKNMLGVRYFTSKLEVDHRGRATIESSINVALPTRTTKSEGFCDFLTGRVHCTSPQAFVEVANVPDRELFTREAADLRQAAGGRYMLTWEGSMHHYQNTPFGRMEYWLDRPEFPVARIDAP